MALRARVKVEPGVGDQVCIKQEPELHDADWGNSEAAYSASLHVKQEPAPLDQEPTSVLQEWMSLQLTEEPVWMGGSGPGTPEVKQEAPPHPAPARAPLDAKYSSLVRDCRVRLERCAIPRGAAERFLTRRLTDRFLTRRLTDRRERQLAMAQLDRLIKPKRKGKNLYICDICKKEFVMLSHLIAHKQIHRKNNETIPVHSARRGATPAKPYLCEICKAGFDDLKTLKVHALIHAKFGKKPYLCKICNTRFSSVLQFNGHCKRHAEVRPFPCRYCGKRFALKSHLARHMFHHKLERELCKACEQTRALRLLGSLMLREEDLHDVAGRCGACGRDT